MPKLLSIQPEKAILQQLFDPLFEEKGIEVWIKREDLIHPQVSGNKWRKLKYNLLHAKQEGHQRLLTFGGAYSNHILATAAIGEIEGFKTIGLIRGEEHLPLNSTLAFAKSCGMQLHYIDRQRYRQKNESQFQQALLQQFENSYLLPEGGTNRLALKGCAEVMKEIPINTDYVCVACGTGGTIAGLIAGAPDHLQVLGIPVLKGASFLYEDIRNLLHDFNPDRKYTNWELHLAYHFGGYAKQNNELQIFISTFKEKHGIELEFVYTGKLFYGLYNLIQQDHFQRGQKIVVLHTGGLRNF